MTYQIVLRSYYVTYLPMILTYISAQNILILSIHSFTNKHITICMDDKPISEVTSVKYLGVLIDSNLSWKSHNDEYSKKIAKSICILSKIRHFLPIDTLILLYYSQMYSFLRYGFEIRFLVT